MSRIRLVATADVDPQRFLDAVHASRDLHHPWTTAPWTADELAALVARTASADFYSFTGVNTDDESLAGVVNLSQVARGNFQSCYAGFYAFVPNQGRGLMRETVALVLDHAFTVEGLHRVEANVQPGNARSLALVAALGLRREGFSPRYLHIDGAWRDHERWAITAEDWRRR